ncbi:MAG TPA: helix-turn-helix domain-containing protein [Solirubrobacteraceae bacterium]|nr:helix-turn-helix domain-containing protein [Solirubrobacteraceae bacterium]
MTDPEPDQADDPWLTIAEFAAEMRVRPVTVRSWIAKGQLRATRAGQRKWLVRRSELTRMLELDDTPSAAPPPPTRSRAKPADPDATPPEVLAQTAAAAAAVEREQADQDYAFAAYEWEIALEQSRMAPPDARFASRIRHIADAASRRAATIRDCMDEPDFVWTPIPAAAGMTLSYELRPGGARPGPKDAWARFDRVVARLGAAMEGTSASAVAGALSDLAGAMNDVADAIETRPARASETSPSEESEDRDAK